MNFTEARKYRDNCLFLVGTRSNLPDFPVEIEHLVIAPVNKQPLDQMKVFNMSLDGISTNESVLKKYGFIEEVLSVYVLGVASHVRYHKLLDEYLIQSGQKEFT